MLAVVDRTCAEKDALSLVHCLLEPFAATSSTAATNEEASFLKRAQKAIGSRARMDVFLTPCTLFRQHFMNRLTLIHRSRAIISDNPDVIQTFLAIVVTLRPKDRTIEDRARKPLEGKKVRKLAIDDLERM